MAKNLKDFDGLITCMDFDSRYIYTMSDQTIFVWDKLDYSLTRTMNCRNDIEVVRDFRVNSKRIYAIGSYNFLVLAKDTADLIYHYKFGCNVTSDFCSFFNDVEKIYLSIRDSHVIAIDKTDYMNTHILDEHDGSVESIDSDQNYVYTGSHDHTVTIWDKKNYEVIDTLKGHNNDVRVTVNEPAIMSASIDGKIIIWDKDTREIRIEQDCHESIDWINSWKQCLITLSNKEHNIKIWDVKHELSLVKEIEIPSLETQSINIDEDYLYLVFKDQPGITLINLEETMNK